MEVTPGKWYAVTTDSSCTVTDANGKVLCTAEAGEQKYFLATTPSITLSDEGATVTKATFNCALAALGLLGGGANELPAGYIRAEFLEGTGAQRVVVDYPSDSRTAWSLKLEKTATAKITVPYVATLNSTARLALCDYEGRWRFDYASQMQQTNSALLNTVYEIALNKNRQCVINGKVVYSFKTADFNAAPSVSLLAAIDGTYSFLGRIWFFRAETEGAEKLELIPALAPSGSPCMFDMVTRKPFYNNGTGSFIVGLTLSQAAQLGRKLPNTGGELTLSLPEGYDMDERVVNSLTNAESKGWVLTIQTYAAQTAAATFALRRVWVRRVQDDNGSYVAADGSRWQVEWCVDIIGADPESLGYERFRSVDAAVAYWELEPYIAPNAEELLTEPE